MPPRKKQRKTKKKSLINTNRQGGVGNYTIQKSNDYVSKSRI